MLKEKAGVIAGTIWNALNETEGMTAKQLKKATKLVRQRSSSSAFGLVN